MARVKRGTTVKQKHNKILARAKGYVKKQKKRVNTHIVIVALKNVNFVDCGLSVLTPQCAIMV